MIPSCGRQFQRCGDVSACVLAIVALGSLSHRLRVLQRRIAIRMRASYLKRRLALIVALTGRGWHKVLGSSSCTFASRRAV